MRRWLKITGSTNRPRGVKNEINYIVREGEITLRDNHGLEYHIDDRKKRKEAYESLIYDEDKKQYTHDRSPNLVHNIVFSSPKIANFPEKDMLKAAEQTLKQKYPENCFFMAYHTDQ